MWLPKCYAEAGRASLSQGYFSFQVSSAMVKDLRLALAKQKKRQAQTTERRGTPSGVGTSAYG
jgi:hypothetical protein